MKFAYQLGALLLFNLPLTAGAISARPSQVLCAASHVVEAKVISAQGYEPSVAGSDTTGRYPHGDTMIVVTKLLGGTESQGLSVVPGKELHIEVSNLEIEYSDRIIPKDEYESRTAMQAQNAAIAAPNGVVGRKYVFLLFIAPNEIAAHSAAIGPTLKGGYAFRASVWGSGEDDERMLYALTDSNAVNGLARPRDRQSCETRYFNPCTSDQTGKSADQLLEVINSAKTSDFMRQCARNLLVTKGRSAVPALIAMLNSGSQEAQELAASTIEKIGPEADAALPALMRIVEAEAVGHTRRHDHVYGALAALEERAASAIPRMIELYRVDEDNNELELALVRLARFSPDLTIPVFVAQLSSPSHRHSAEYDLQRIGKSAKAAFPALVNVLNADLSRQNYDNLNQLTVTIASVADKEESVPIFIGLLSNPKAAERAAGILESMGADADLAIPALLRGLHNSQIDHKARLAFAEALTKMGVRSSLIGDFLIEELAGEFRQSAAEAMQAIDPLPASYASRLIDAIGQNKNDYPINLYLCVSLSHIQSSQLELGCNPRATPRDVVFGPRLDPANCKPPSAVGTAAHIANYCTCRPDYPQSSFEAEEQGTIVIRFNVAANGKLIDAKVSQSSGYGTLDRVTLKAAKRCQFKPKITHGKPEAASFEQTFSWLLNDNGNGITLNGQ